jgi:dTDP-4-dehydrorhamnose reductase
VRILVTGREGQVARSLVERASGRGFEIVTLGRPQLDLAGPADAIIAAMEATQPDTIVSAAAYTLVENAESEPELAFSVNERGAAAIARAASRLGVPLIHLSTDYVFDGTKAEPYVEDDPPHPMGVYGASKLAGENAVLAEHDDCAVLRTAWVYSPFGANFVKTMLRLAETRDEVSVVADQRGNPTSALDIADALLSVAANLRVRRGPELRGTFHMAASGEASWAELAQAVFDASAQAGGPSAKVNRISNADYPTVAKRPANSRLNCSRLERVHGLRLPDWRESLQVVVDRVVHSDPPGAATR